MPALSNAPSLDSSHLRSLGSLNPCGGGPDGVAVRGAEVENAATEHAETARGVICLEIVVVGGRARASAASDREEAMTRRM